MILEDVYLLSGAGGEVPGSITAFIGRGGPREYLTPLCRSNAIADRGCNFGGGQVDTPFDYTTLLNSLAMAFSMFISDYV